MEALSDAQIFSSMESLEGDNEELDGEDEEADDVVGKQSVLKLFFMDMAT